MRARFAAERFPVRCRTKDLAGQGADMRWFCRPDDGLAENCKHHRGTVIRCEPSKLILANSLSSRHSDLDYILENQIA